MQPGNIPTKHFQLLTTTTSHPNSHTPPTQQLQQQLLPTHPQVTHYLTQSPQIHQLDRTLANPQNTQAFTPPPPTTIHGPVVSCGDESFPSDLLSEQQKRARTDGRWTDRQTEIHTHLKEADHWVGLAWLLTAAEGAGGCS